MVEGIKENIDDEARWRQLYEGSYQELVLATGSTI
jgi:hypothetical protein